MMFREVLAGIIDGTPGALAGAIMGSDGIPVDEYRAVQDSLDLDTVAIEFQRVLEQAIKVASALYGPDGGELEELVLRTSAHQLLFRQLDDEHFVVIALAPGGMLGKARYLLRSVLHKVRQEL
jgi:predicted regulator of Ras-like GTPase activity (Roadblock/LC7/MglB family)